MNALLATAFVSALLLSPASSHACGGADGWANPDASTPIVSLADAISHARSVLGVQVTKSQLQSKCGGDIDYTVVDTNSGKALGTIPVPRQSESANDGRTLSVRLQQLLQASRTEIVELENARRIFYDDVEGLKEDLGIGAYVPNAYPIEQRTQNNGQDYLVFVNIDGFCSEGYQERPSLVYQGLAIKTLEYIPGRTDYSAKSIYQKGDLKRAIIGNTEVMAEIKKRVASNAQFCADDNFGKKQKWIEVNARLNGSLAELLKSTVERFSTVQQKASDAYMLNENRIVVTYAQGERQFAGAVAEMVEIQAMLSKKGVKIDKLGRLNWEGKIAVDFAREQNRPLPASLQE